MESKKYNSVAKRVSKWSEGMVESDYETFYLPARDFLDRYLNNNLTIDHPNPMMQIAEIHSAIGRYGWWHYLNFLEQYFNHSKNEDIWKWWLEAAESRILEYSFGYVYPQNIAPYNEGRIALAICDSIILNDKLGERIVEGYSLSKNAKRPINPQSVIQYAYSIYYHYVKKDIFDFLAISNKKMLDVYSNLFSNIESPDDHFLKTFNDACEFHLERSKGSLLYEFYGEDDMIIPSELIATLIIRDKLGLNIGNVKHPLAVPFLPLIGLQNKKENITDFLKSIKKKIENDFFN